MGLSGYEVVKGSALSAFRTGAPEVPDQGKRIVSAAYSVILWLSPRAACPAARPPWDFFGSHRGSLRREVNPLDARRVLDRNPAVPVPYRPGVQWAQQSPDCLTASRAGADHCGCHIASGDCVEDGAPVSITIVRCWYHRTAAGLSPQTAAAPRQFSQALAGRTLFIGADACESKANLGCVGTRSAIGGILTRIGS